MPLHWAFWAALAPLCWSLGVLIDQYVARVHSSGSPGRFVALIGLGSFPFVLLMAFLAPNVFGVSPVTAIGLLAIGCATMLANWPYMLALQNDDVSIAVPLFQCVPVFTFILGWLLLGETPNMIQIAGTAIVISAAILSVWDFKAHGLRLRTLLLMLCACLIFASSTVSLRFFAERTEIWQTVFWEMSGFLLAGLATVIFNRKIRLSMFAAFAETKGLLYLWGWAQNMTEFFAQICLVTALAVAPSVGMVTVMGGLNPFYILIMGTLASFIRPGIFTRARPDKVLLQKLVCAVFLIIGLYILLVLGTV